MVRRAALNGYVEVLRCHQAVLEHITSEADTQTGLLLGRCAWVCVCVCVFVFVCIVCVCVCVCVCMCVYGVCIVCACVCVVCVCVCEPEEGGGRPN